MDLRNLIWIKLNGVHGNDFMVVCYITFQCPRTFLFQLLRLGIGDLVCERVGIIKGCTAMERCPFK